MERIIIELDDQTAQAFKKVGIARKKQMTRVINAWLKRTINNLTLNDYRKMLDDMGKEAEKNGLTPEILEQLLKEDD